MRNNTWQILVILSLKLFTTYHWRKRSVFAGGRTKLRVEESREGAKLRGSRVEAKPEGVEWGKTEGSRERQNRGVERGQKPEVGREGSKKLRGREGE